MGPGARFAERVRESNGLDPARSMVFGSGGGARCVNSALLYVHFLLIEVGKLQVASNKERA